MIRRLYSSLIKVPYLRGILKEIQRTAKKLCADFPFVILSMDWKATTLKEHMQWRPRWCRIE